MDDNEFAELALGVDSELTRLFAGVPGESDAEREVRMDAAADILADLHREDLALAAYAERLLNTAPVPLRRRAGTRPDAAARQVAA
ncbi:hypothetical protein [Kitasatospora sp. NPDC048538]|uniref:hypothetical protein n=1 Tax=unclassified Kitasatospora TaxID=2633591 RepID=UPI00340DAD26